MRKFCLADKTVNSFVIAVYMPMMCWRNGVLVNWKNDDLFSDAEFRKDVLQDFVGGDGAAAHDDAIAALGEVLQDLPLGHGHADGLVHDLEGGYAEPVADGQGVRGLYTLFGHVRYVVLIKAVFLGDHFDDLVVVAGDVQRLCQTLAQLTTAGAKFCEDWFNSPE